MAAAGSSRVNRSTFPNDQLTSGRIPANIRNRSTEYTIIVKLIPANVSREAIIDFASRFGTLAYEPHITQITERLHKLAFLTFTEQSAVQTCINGDRRAYTISGYPVVVQRWIPLTLSFETSFRLLLFLQKNNLNNSLSEDDIRTYFDTNYGQTKAFSWTSDSAATLDFEDYDSTDRVVLDSLIHTINGIELRVEKVKSSHVRAANQHIVAPHTVQFCVHVKNIPPHVSGEQLADIFNSNVWDVLIRRGIYPDTDPFEAWIMNIPTLENAEQLAASVNCIEGVDIECNAEKEPLNEWTLCNGNRDGWCKHGDDCIYRHVTCPSGDDCTKEECLFSHTKKRKTLPNPKSRPPGPIDQHYRIKIDGLPYHMKAIELLTGLRNQQLTLLKSIETSEVPEDSETRHFYLVRQAAEKLVRKRVYEWHNYPIRENYIVKCQLEYDRAPSAELSSNSFTTSGTTLQKHNQRLRTIFGPLTPDARTITGLPSEWVWTNRQLGKMSRDVYLVYPTNPRDDRLGAMKIYRDQTKSEAMRARRELQALRTFKNESGVASVYESNVSSVTRRRDAPMWIITQLISELTLEDFVDKTKSEITFHQALLLAQQLLEIVQRCHKVHIFHRNLHPSNVLVQQSTNHTSIDEIKLVLVGFGSTWIDSQQSTISDDDDLKIIDQVIQRYSKQGVQQSSEHDAFLPRYLLSTSSKNERCSPTIDSTGVCRILFWLLSNEWIDQMDYGNEYQRKINTKLGEFQSDVKLQTQIKLLFDRAFGSFENRWSVDDLLNQLNMLNTLIVKLETAQLDALFPTTTAPELLPFSDLYARIVALIAFVKQQFVEQHSTCIKWSAGRNKWSTKNKDVEVKNTDGLIYDFQDQHCTLPITLLARIETDQTALFVGISAEDETIELKYLSNLTKETNDMDVAQCFAMVVKKFVRDELKKTYSS